MSGLPTEEQSLYILETSDHESPPAAEIENEPEIEGIETGYVTRDVALKSFVSAPELAQGSNLEARIAHISAEIEELREYSSDSRLVSLLSSLRDVQKVKFPQGSQAKSEIFESERDAVSIEAGNSGFLEDLHGFAELEKRVAAVEHRVGFSERPEPIALVLSDIRRKVEILSASPDDIESRKAKLQQIVAGPKPTDKYSRLYDRLRTLEPLIEQLPQVLSRLQTLNVVHSESARVTEVVSSLDSTLTMMATDMVQWKETLENLENQIQEAIKTSNSNIEQMDRYNFS